MSGFWHECVHSLIANPTWTGIGICAISFGESLVGIGLLIPGTIVMTLIGSLVGSGILPLPNTLAWITLGAILGDVASYYLGYYYHHHFKWLLQKMPKTYARAELFFKKYGWTGVVASRFMGPLRSIIPLIAGIMHMPQLKFTSANIVSAILWAPLYCMPGYVASRHGVSVELMMKAVIFGSLGLWAAGIAYKVWRRPK